MFANVTLQDILATLQAPPPEMQAAPGFSQLLQYSEADWSQWLEQLQQLDGERQDLAALPASFLQLPESGIDRQAVEGMGFLELDATVNDATDSPDSAMAMLAALLYQPEIHANTQPDAPGQQVAMWAMKTRAGVDASAGGPVPWTEVSSDRAPGETQVRPVVAPASTALPQLAYPMLSSGTLQEPALGVMTALTTANSRTMNDASLAVPEKDLDTPQLAQALQARMAASTTQNTPGTPPTPVLQAHSPAFAQQMQQQVQFMLRQDMKQMDVRLDPPELGAMKIHLKLDNGLTHVQIITATAEARDLLHASQAHIREALPLAQGQLQLDIRQHGGGPFDMQGEGQFAGQNGADAGGPASEAAPREESPAHRWVGPAGGQGLVDTFV